MKYFQISDLDVAWQRQSFVCRGHPVELTTGRPASMEFLSVPRGEAYLDKAGAVIYDTITLAPNLV
jgi:hypothetical protein